MAGLTFSPVAASLPLYRSDRNRDDLALSLYYLLTQDQSSPASLDFASTWRDRSGAYVFLPTSQPITDPAAFAAALDALLTPQVPQSQWIGWIASPAVEGGSLAGVQLVTIAKQVGETRGRVVGAGGTRITFANLALAVQPETIAANDPADDAPALILQDDSTNGGLLALEQLGTTRSLDLPRQAPLRIDFDGDGIGAWRFELRSNRGIFYTLFQDPTQSSQTPPSAEMRFGFRDQGQDQALRFPVLLGDLRDPANPPRRQLPLSAQVDPLHPTDDRRTHFRFVLGDYGPNPDQPLLPTSLAFRTTAGNVLHLRPLDGAGFALAKRVPNPVSPEPPAFLYLTPTGRFEVAPQNPGAAAGEPIAENALLLMCGIVGTEFLLAAEEDRLDFTGAHPSFAPRFPDAAGGDPASPLLDETLSSAWVKLIPGPKSDETFPGFIKQSFCMQAIDAVYYQLEGASGLPFPVAVGARLADLSQPDAVAPFPLVPYGWVYVHDRQQGITDPNPGVAGTTLERYEQEVIAPARRQAIALDRCLGPLFFNLANLDALTGWVETPQGLLVELNDGPLDSNHPTGTWKRLLLARSPEKKHQDQLLQLRAGTTPNACTAGAGPFNVVSPLLSTVLMEGTPFLVVTEPAPLGTFDNVLNLGFFPFEIAVSGDDTGSTDLGSNTVLVFKLDPSRPFTELADAPATWSDAATFVGDAAQTTLISSQIHAFIEEAERQSEAARLRGAFDYFASFLRQVRSPTWTGILALNVPLLLNGLPLALKMLLGGLRSPRPLRGHHFGITVNQPKKDLLGLAAGEVPLEKSSLFALVFYDEALQTPVDMPYDFQTLKLNALYDNAVLERFEAQIAFSSRDLFDDPTRLVQGGENDRLESNTIVIDGALQEQDGETTVVFATDEIRVFDFPTTGGAARVLATMVGRRASLEPIDSDGKIDPETIRSAFVLNGGLGFTTQPASNGPDIDLFSFALDPEDAAQLGLGYTAYDFAMTTEIRGDKGTLLGILLDLARLQLDVGEAIPRALSLIGTLPLKVIGFRLDPDLAALGAKTVTGIGLDGATPRFAMELSLVMGTLGALSNQSPLEGSLLLGWRPGGDAATADQTAMLFLPPEDLADSGGFRLQGVFQTAYARVLLERPKLTKEDTGATKYVYVLTLTPIDFLILSLPLIPPAAIRSLTFFGDPNSSPSATDGTNLGWYLGQPLPPALTDGAPVPALPAGDGTRAGEDATRIVAPIARRSDLLIVDNPAGLVPARDASTQAELIFSPVAGILAGLKVKTNPQATIVIGPAISKLLAVPLSTQDTLNGIFNGSLPDVNYDPAAGVTVWFDITFLNVTFQAVFQDPYLYGGRIEVADPTPDAKGLAKFLGGLKLEIVYRRISDDLGVWSGFLTLPKRFREIELSKKLKLTLPSVGMAYYTNGDWRVDIGWPFGSTTTFIAADQIILEFEIKGIPFKATAGLYLAKLRSADNPEAFGNDFALIWMFGLGLSFGLAKEFPKDGKGPVKLSLEAYLWTSLEGMLASKHGEMVQYGVDYYWFAGALGLTVNATGKVDFKIIKASLELEATVVFTWAIETDHATQLEIRAQFKINLSVKLLFVKISFRFTADIKIADWTFGSGPIALVSGPTVNATGTLAAHPRLGRPRKDLDNRLVSPLAAGRAATQVDVPIALVLQPTARASGGASAPQAIASLLIELVPGGTGVDPFAQLVQGTGNWLKERYGGAAPLTDQLSRIIAKIDDGTFDSELTTFLSSAFRFRIQASRAALDADAEPTAAVFPMFPWLALTYHGGEIPFDRPAVPDDYARELALYFEQLAAGPPATPPADDDLRSFAALATAGVPQTVSGIVFSDFFDLLAKQLVRELQDLADLDPSLTFDQALAALGPEGYENIAGTVSRYAQYGLRLPTTQLPIGSQLDALYTLSRQQVALVQDAEGVWDTTFTLGYADGVSVGDWIQFGADGTGASVEETLDPNLVLTQAIDTPWIAAGGGFQPLPVLEAFDLRFFFGDIRTWTELEPGNAVTIRQLRPLPESLQRLVDTAGSLPLRPELVDGHPTTPGARFTADARTAITAAPTLFIPLALDRIPGPDGEPLEGVYALVGTDEATRARIERLIDAPALASATLHMLAATGDSAYRSTPGDASIVLAKTNLSTLSEPPTLNLSATHDRQADPTAGPTHAKLVDTRDFLWLVWELSVVHTGGFFLYMDDLPSGAFDNGKAEIAVLATFGAAVAEPVFERYHNMLEPGEIPPADRAVAAAIVEVGGGVRQAYRPSVPIGSAGFRIAWDQPPTAPTLDDQSADAQKKAYLEAIYNILQYRVEAIAPGPAAAAVPALPSNWSLPIGGTLPDDSDLDAPTAEARWLFSQSLPVSRFLAEANRFAAVGTRATFAVRVLDVYGNELPARHTVGATVLYNDPLVPVNEWPGMIATYNVSPGGGDQATLDLVLRFTPSDSLIGGDDPDARRQAILDARTEYRLVRDQLEDANASAQVKTILAPQPLTQTLAGSSVDQAMAAFVRDAILPYLDRLLAGETPTPPAPAHLTFGLAPSDIGRLPRDLFALTLSLVLRRDAAKIDPEIRAQLPAVERVQSPLAPNVDLEAELRPVDALDEPATEETTLRAFAEAFEQAYAGFGGAGTLVKIAEGAEASTSLQTATTRQLWAVRWGGDAGIVAAFPNAVPTPPVAALPFYLAPMPLSTQLITRQVSVRIYDGELVVGDQERLFANIDMDVFGRDFLLAVHATLGPEMATAIATLDGDLYNRLIGLKEALANAIFLGLAPVLEVPGQPADPTVARERFRQALLSALPADYSLSAVVQVPADIRVARTDQPTIPPQLYGDVSPPDTSLTQAFSLSAAKLPTTPGREPLPYLVATKNPAEQAFLDLEPAFELGFVEHDFLADEARFGYVPSSWLSFVAPLFAPDGGTPPLTLPMGRNVIPIPLRVYPPLPVIENQGAEVKSTATTVGEALRWAYTLDVVTPQSAQDTLELRITFNEPPVDLGEADGFAFLAAAPAAPGVDPPRDPPVDLFAALARFAFEFPQIRPDLAKVPAAAFQGEGVPAAILALQRFRDLVQGAADTWASWPNPALPAAQARARTARLAALGESPNLPRQAWRFTVDFRDKPDLRVVRAIEDSAELPPWPTIEGFISPTTTGAVGTFTAIAGRGAGSNLTALQAHQPEGRLSMSFVDLFLLTQESARPTAHVERNANLVPDTAPAGTSVNPAFVYRTPNVTLDDPTVPLVQIRDTIDLPFTANLTTALDDLFRPFVDPSQVPGGLVVLELRFGLDAVYQFTLAQGDAGDQMVEADTPTFLVRENVRTARNPDTEPPKTLAEVKAELVRGLSDWYNALQPSDQGAHLRFGLTAFALLTDTPLPLAQFRAVRVPVPEGDPSWWS